MGTKRCVKWGFVFRESEYEVSFGIAPRNGELSPSVPETPEPCSGPRNPERSSRWRFFLICQTCYPNILDKLLFSNTGENTPKFIKHSCLHSDSHRMVCQDLDTVLMIRSLNNNRKQCVVVFSIMSCKNMLFKQKTHLRCNISDNV